jgi:glycosyltransferase involved in cell wall biosynthesis
MSADIFFSYIVPTIGRLSLDVAVQSVLEQDFALADFEVIVVNDSGSQLREAEWRASPRVKVINTHKCERSFARNSGAAVARGKYLAFLDDDDWILPGALNHFWQLAQRNPEAVWLYGAVQIVDEKDGILAEINSRLEGNIFSQIIGGAWAPLQASVIQARAFFAVGAFSPFICGTEDEDLCRRIAFTGSFANTPAAVGCLYRGQSWGTSTNYLRAPEDTKYSRDLLLSTRGALRRMLATANTSYWSGRNARVYFSTVGWNLKKRRVFSALDRFVSGLAAVVAAPGRLFFRDFWAGFRADHVPESLHFVMKRYYEKNRKSD